MNNNGRNGKLIEFILCLTLGCIVSSLLFEVCIATMKPLTNQLEKTQRANVEYSVMLEESGPEVHQQ